MININLSVLNLCYLLQLSGLTRHLQSTPLQTSKVWLLAQTRLWKNRLDLITNQKAVKWTKYYTTGANR